MIHESAMIVYCDLDQGARHHFLSDLFGFFTLVTPCNSRPFTQCQPYPRKQQKRRAHAERADIVRIRPDDKAGILVVPQGHDRGCIGDANERVPICQLHHSHYSFETIPVPTVRGTNSESQRTLHFISLLLCVEDVEGGEGTNPGRYQSTINLNTPCRSGAWKSTVYTLSSPLS